MSSPGLRRRGRNRSDLPLNADINVTSPVDVAGTREGQVFIEEDPVTVEQFEESFPQMAAAANLERVYLRADSLSAYGPVLKIMATLAQSELVWSLVGEPYVPR